MNQKIKSSSYYNRAPILEAILDFQVHLPEKADLAKAIKLIKKEYPEENKIRQETTQIQLSEHGSTFTTNHENIGYKLTSTDKKRVVQIRNNGFSFSILGNYESWDAFLKTAQALWEIYHQKLKPVRVNRVAVRYINRIDIPELKFDLENYFYTYPNIFKNNQADISAFFMQVQIPQKEGGMAILNQSIAPPPNPGYTSIILDIDVFDLKNFEPNGKELWDRIEKLREQKNIVFEQSITDETRKLFS
jgi:uncharacterized protein (TIGR04255 family)